MEAPPIEKSKISAEQTKITKKVEKLLGRKEIKKPGRLNRFLGEVVPGYENRLGGYWQKMADYLEQVDVEEALENGMPEAEIKREVLGHREVIEEEAVIEVAKDVQKTVEEELTELKEEMENNKNEVDKILEEEIDIDVSEFDEGMEQINKEAEKAKSEIIELTEDMVIEENKTVETLDLTENMVIGKDVEKELEKVKSKERYLDRLLEEKDTEIKKIKLDKRGLNRRDPKYQQVEMEEMRVNNITKSLERQKEEVVDNYLEEGRIKIKRLKLEKIRTGKSEPRYQKIEEEIRTLEKTIDILEDNVIDVTGDMIIEEKPIIKNKLKKRER